MKKIPVWIMVLAPFLVAGVSIWATRAYMRRKQGATKGEIDEQFARLDMTQTAHVPLPEKSTACYEWDEKLGGYRKVECKKLMATLSE